MSTQKGNNPQTTDREQQRIEDMDLKNVRADHTAADFDETARQAEEERQELKPGQKAGPISNQHNNGRGGGK